MFSGAGTRSGTCLRFGIFTLIICHQLSGHLSLSSSLVDRTLSASRVTNDSTACKRPLGLQLPRTVYPSYRRRHRPQLLLTRARYIVFSLQHSSQTHGLFDNVGIGGEKLRELLTHAGQPEASQATMNPRARGRGLLTRGVRVVSGEGRRPKVNGLVSLV